MTDSQFLIKLLLIVVITAVALRLILPGKGSRGLAMQRIAALIFLICGVLAIIFPDITQRVADILGIGRGLDLVFLVFLVAGFAFFVNTTLQQRRHHREFTKLARKVALLEAQLDEERDLS